MRIFALALVVVFLPAAFGKYYGGDPPRCMSCERCATCSNASAGGGMSLTEGNLNQSFGVTSSLRLNYNSYDADDSRATIDTVLGYGWTHSFNLYLFNQLNHMFRMDENGRITKFSLIAGGAYKAAQGYFDTLVKNGDGTFTITTKEKTKYQFALIAGTPFLVAGPVYRVTSIVDRNNNTTTFTYTSGNLTTVTDTYGRVHSFAYNAAGKVTSETDPLGRVTTFAYDPTGHLLTSVTDPMGRVTGYTYNTLFQITRRTDRAGRITNYQYTSLRPTGSTDGGNQSNFRMTNPANWGTNATALASSQLRVYTPSTSTRTGGTGQNWNYTYDANGYVTQIVAPDGATTRYTYDPASLQVATHVDPLGNTTQYSYDALGNRTSQTDALGHTTSYTYEPVYNQVTSITDPNGRVTTYQYDASGNRVADTDPLGQSQHYSYDSHGNVTSYTDKRGGVTTYQYDGFGNRIKTTDAAGGTTQGTYDAVGNLLTGTDANGHTTTYQYDALDRLTRKTNPLGGVSQYGYDFEGNRTQVTDPNGRTTAYTYDQRHRLTQVTDPASKVTTYTYDANNNRITSTDRNGRQTRYFYDTQDRQIRTTNPLGGNQVQTYDGQGNVLTQTDPLGRVTTYQYDTLNRQTRTTDPIGSTSQTFYDTTGGCPTCTGPTLGSNLPSKTIDGNGKVTYYKYDGLDRQVILNRKEGDVADVIDPSDAVSRTSYDANSNRVQTIAPNGNTTAYTYDSLNRQVTTTNPAGETTTTSYDPVGNRIGRSDPNGNVTTYTYDALDRRTQAADSGGTISTTAYDPVGNVVSSTDANGNATTYTYDSLDRRTSQTDATGQPSTSSYDAVGNRLQTTDREGRVTQYQYDALDRRTRMTNAMGHVTQYQYDAVSNRTRIIDPLNRSTIYTYDAANRLTRVTYPDAVPNTVDYAYDAVGNQISRKDQKSKTTTYTYNDLYFRTKTTYTTNPADNYTYDLSGRMLTAERGGWLVTMVYDGADRLTQSVQNGKLVTYSYNIPSRTRTITYPGGRTITETMDPRSRLTGVNDGGITPIGQYTYDAANRALTRTQRNGVVATYTYDALNRVTALEHFKGPSRVVGFSYAYDREGNKRFEEKRHAVTRSEAYAYDPIYRLTDYRTGTLVGTTVPAPLTSTQYTLDALSNWTTKTVNGVPQARVHNAANEITSVGGSPVLHDDDGNLAEDSLLKYSYDEENRIATVVQKPSLATLGTYQYDALGRRVEKSDSISTTRYFYDAKRVIEEQVPLGTTMATYVYGRQLDEPLTMDRGGATYYYHQNALGSVHGLTNSAGALVEGYTYDVYGRHTAYLPGVNATVDFGGDDVTSTGNQSFFANPYLFTGRSFDPESGLHYYRARQYSSVLGRFLSRDPRGYTTGLNLYEYARSNPSRYLDPSGKISVEPVDRWLSPDGATCGSLHYQTWEFSLDNPAPCDGYIVQKVVVTDRSRPCSGCDSVYGGGPTHTYYEAWHVGEGDTKTDYANLIYDRASWTHTPGTCGIYFQEGIIKFFCDGTTGDLGGEGIDGPAGSGWRTNRTFGNTAAGDLPASGAAPGWWMNRPVEEGQRSFSNRWCCCGSNENSESSANPTKSRMDAMIEGFKSDPSDWERLAQRRAKK